MKAINNKLLNSMLEDYLSNPSLINKISIKENKYIFLMIRKMSNRFLKKGLINEKLLINNIIICINIFGITNTNIILRTITNDNEWSIIKPFLTFLKCYNLENDNIEENRIINDILNDITTRYNLPKE